MSRVDQIIEQAEQEMDVLRKEADEVREKLKRSEEIRRTLETRIETQDKNTRLLMHIGSKDKAQLAAAILVVESARPTVEIQKRDEIYGRGVLEIALELYDRAGPWE